MRCPARRTCPTYLTVVLKKWHFSGLTVSSAAAKAENNARTAWDITNPKQLKGFLGLANWYALYIPKFAQHAAPLNEALRGKYQFEAAAVSPNGRLNPDGTPLKKRKRVKLSAKESRILWNDAMRVGLRAIKDSLVDTVNLYIRSPERRWRIFTDAGDYAVPGTLEQEQLDGSFHPVEFFSKKLQGTGSGHGAQGQRGWTPPEKETYAVLCCLLKFQAWIGVAEAMVKADHGSILQWYKEDLCTISGPLGRWGRWHEFLSRFNLTIKYHPGDQNVVADCSSPWAYPAGAAQDSNFHGSDLDLEGWGRDEREAVERGRQQLKQDHPELFQLEATLLRIMAESSDEPPHPPVDQGDASEDQEFMSVRSYNRSLRHMWTDAASDLSEYPHAHSMSALYISSQLSE